MPSRLKSLELYGYKTFASRSEFVFAETVTAIVGPNGSGKSNLADSLRWVLGEQSYSLLRGKKTEDMIYYGSEARPRASMAEATVTFDNSDGWLPIDFSEVAITRRAYRDGENEYLLNGQRVRLKDISELLAKSGLAERTYTIIGQGLVDAALALKAEERRRLFEEAAGIGLYRSRREESLRRLENTHRNLERVQDILAELQPRLRSLERQARRSQEYEQVRADMRILLRDWYGYHWHRAQRELTEALELARQREQALDQTRSKQSTLDQQLNTFRDQLSGLRARLTTWHRQLAQLHTRRESLSRDLAVAEERSRWLVEQRQNASNELQRLEGELALQQDRLEVAKQGLEAIHLELEEARTHGEAAQRELQERQSEHLTAEKALLDARQAQSELAARQEHTRARLNEQQTLVQRQEEAVQAAAQAVLVCEQEAQAGESRLQAALRTRQEAETELRSAEEALRAHRMKLDELETIRRKTLETRSTAQAEGTRLRTQAQVLEQSESTLTGYAEGTKLLLQAAFEARLTGVRGAFSGFLEVPATYEAAIAAALGEYVDAVVLEGDADIEGALERLAGETARAALLPLGSLTPSIVSSKGEIGEWAQLASGLVKAPPEFQPAIDVLLGQVWVVSDRAVARALVSKMRSSGQEGLSGRVVTLRGEVFHVSGPVLAGQEAKAGVLARPRQRRELQENLGKVEEQLARLDEQLRRFEAVETRLRSEETTLSQSAEQARQGEKATQVAHGEADLALEKARRQLQWQREQRTRLEAEMARTVEETRQMKAGLSGLLPQIDQAKDFLRERNAALLALSLDEYQETFSHWSTRRAVAERAVADGQVQVRERQTNLDLSRQMLEAVRSRLNEFETSQQALESEKASLRQAEEAIHAEIEALQVQVEPAEAELESAEKDQERIQSAEAEARQLSSQSEHHHAQAKITQAHKQEALDSLRLRIQDDFGLVAFEYADEVSGPTPLPLDGIVEQLPHLTELPIEIEDSLQRQRAQLRRMGPVNPEAQAEYQEVKQRYEFLTTQVNDLQEAERGIKEVIAELDLLMEREFRRTFEAVAREFREIFTRLFGGGSARLLLTDPDDLTITGIDIEARLPGRREQGLSLLSGGERSLTATALVFSLLKVSPTPFCVLDEVDAMLDEANVGRFRELLRELSQSTQFIIITHNRNTVQVADVLYGVTMGRDSASQVVSLKLDEVSRVVD